LNSKLDPNQYLGINIRSKEEVDELTKLVDEIVKESKSDYDKLLKIHNWVADNIYYNWDGSHGLRNPEKGIIKKYRPSLTSGRFYLGITLDILSFTFCL
jgi:hypothetical protein